MSLTRTIVAAALATSAVLLPQIARAASDVCIEEKARQALAACPNTGPQSFDVTKHGKAPQVNFSSAPPPADLKKRDQDSKPKNPSLEFSASQRDGRQQRLQARAKALLVTEIQGLESLFNTTPKNAPDRPELARRLADDYVELESAAFREKIQSEVDRDTLKKTNPQEAGRKQTAANQAAGIMSAARGKAVEYYKLLKNEYPQHPKLDEILYYLAYEYEQANDLANARKAYLELIDKAPKSKYVPNAYLAFGELFFNEAQGDPSQWDHARDAYKKVIEYPPEKNKVYGYAWYKLAYVFWNKGEFENALNAFKKTIDYGVSYATEPNAAKLADSARRDIVPVYALRGDPAAAYNFFHNISGDDPGQTAKTYKMMDDLGQNYLDTGHYQEAISLYRDLIVRDKNGDKHCLYQTHISEAVLALKSGNKDAIKQELDNQVRAYNDFKSQSHGPEAKQECANRTAALLSESAMAWHLETVGSHGQRGTGDQKTMTLAAAVYEQIAKTWTAKEFETFTFPRIVKDDWPNIYKIKYAMADLLYFQERWDKCGPAFDSVVAENPNASEAAEAAYASVLCYQKIYEQTHAKGEDRRGGGNLPGQGRASESQRHADEDAKLKPKELTDNQKGMLQAFNRYICYIHPGPSDTAGQDQLTEVKYARSRTYFEAQHWEEAGAGFREIAVQNSDKDVGIYAAQLYLESINVLAAHAGHTSCFDDMSRDVPEFIKLYCSGDKQAKNAEQCTSLNKIQVDLLRIKAESLVKIADQGGNGQVENYTKAAQAYFELFRNNCEAPILAGQPPQAERCDEIVYNAARAFQAARLLAKAVTARMKLLDPRLHLETSPLAKKARYEIGGNYQAIAVYDLAAEWFERYADADKSADKAEAALSDAVQLRLGLGQEEQGLKDAALFTKNYGATKPAQTAAIAFAVGAHFAEKEDWDRAKTELTKYMGVIDKAAPDVQVQAHATLARAYTHLKGGQNSAKSEYGRVRGLWQNPEDAAARIKSAYTGEDEGQYLKRLGKALNAVGEAYFFSAEEARTAKVDPIKFPEYHGNGTKEDVVKHINTKVVDWYQKKIAAIRSVEPDYIKILELKPVPPPKWVIAAGSRSGLMWGDFVDDFRRAPIPKAWARDAEMRGVYYDALDGKSQPFKDNSAKPALKKCLDLSVQYQYFDEFSRNCEVWLAKNYKSEYHVVDELHGAPTLANSGLDDKPPPLVVGGSAWHPVVATPDKSPGSDADKGDKGDTGPKAAPAPHGGAPHAGGRARPTPKKK